MSLKQELFRAAYATNLASEALARMADTDVDALELDKLRALRRTLQSASAAMLALENIVAGNPEPKRGE